MRELPRAHRLADGATVDVRHVRPSDERALRDAFRSLSASSRYQRFLCPATELSDSLWRYLCNVDGRDHVALAAFPGGQSHAVGVARFVRQSTSPRIAEVAVTIVDASTHSSRTRCRTTWGFAGCSLALVRSG